MYSMRKLLNLSTGLPQGKVIGPLQAHTLYCPTLLGHPLLMKGLTYFSNFHEYKS